MKRFVATKNVKTANNIVILAILNIIEPIK